MKVYVTRGSVHAGDDVDAPHAENFVYPDGTELKAIVADLTTRYLPTIVGGKASWSVVSNVVVGVTASQWHEPKLYLTLDRDLDWRDGLLCLHFNYHAQKDPDALYDVFWGMRFRAQ